MSKARLDGKPLLAKSTIRLQSRAVLWSNSATLHFLQTLQVLCPNPRELLATGTSGSLTKSKRVTRHRDTDALDLDPDCYSMSCELRFLMRRVGEKQRKADSAKPGFAANPTASLVSMFERGRFYDLYSSRRNERMKKKRGNGNWGTRRKAAMVESAERKDNKKLESARKSVCGAYSSVERNETPAPRLCLGAA